MITRYQIMRGLLKRRTIREMAWRAVAAVNRGRTRAYLDQQAARMNESVFVYTAAQADAAAQAVAHDGAAMGPALSPGVIEAILAYAQNRPCYADRDPKLGFHLPDRQRANQALGKDVFLAQYFNIHHCDAIDKLSQDPFLLSVAARYLGVPPKLMSMNMWWTFPAHANAEDLSKHAQVFHYDLDDLRFIKFFYYLTDVSMLTGPHVYVRSSNRDIRYKNSLIRSKRFTDQEVQQAYGDQNIIHVTGPAGSCLIEDTITLHKGTPPVDAPRLMLQFEFSINTYDELSCICDESETALVV